MPYNAPPAPTSPTTFVGWPLPVWDDQLMVVVCCRATFVKATLQLLRCWMHCDAYRIELVVIMDAERYFSLSVVEDGTLPALIALLRTTLLLGCLLDGVGCYLLGLLLGCLRMLLDGYCSVVQCYICYWLLFACDRLLPSGVDCDAIGYIIGELLHGCYVRLFGYFIATRMLECTCLGATNCLLDCFYFLLSEFYGRNASCCRLWSYFGLHYYLLRYMLYMWESLVELKNYRGITSQPPGTPSVNVFTTITSVIH